jgi:uncharacterized protein (TIGR02145 family)
MEKKLRFLAVILFTLSFHSCKEEPGPPVLSTNEVIEITTSSALSGGAISDDSGAPIISRGVCWSNSENPTIEDNKTVVNVEAASFNSSLSQLLPKTKYYVRAYATNNAGTGYGNILSFTTLGDKPGTNALSTTNIQINSSTINGSVNPFSLSTIVTFEWGTTTNYGNSIVASQSPVTGNNLVNLSADLSGLAPGTIYHFRLKAENSLGVAYSGDLTFKTLGDIPSITINDATNIQLNSVVINGSVNPNYLPTIVAFEWGITSNYGNIISSIQNPFTGNTSVNLSTRLPGLAPGTIYHFRLKAENSLGIIYSNDKTFKTLGDVPTAESLSATNLQYNTASLKGRVNPKYFSTTASFEWGETTFYGNSVPISQDPLNDSTFVDVSADLSGLTQDFTYHFRIRAENELGTTYSNDITFTTLAPITDIEGNQYNIRTIGSQIWMTENLRTGKYNNGDPISTTSPATLDISEESTPKYQWSYDGNEDYVPTHGRLYTWYAVTDIRGVCPTGWHLPSDKEWTVLLNYLIINGFGYEGSGDDIAKSLASKTGWISWNTPGTIGNNPSANNGTGFTALPSGARVTYTGGLEFSMLNSSCAWWSSTQLDASIALQTILVFNEPRVSRTYYGSKKIGVSTRCLKN